MLEIGSRKTGYISPLGLKCRVKLQHREAQVLANGCNNRNSEVVVKKMKLEARSHVTSSVTKRMFTQSGQTIYTPDRPPGRPGTEAGPRYQYSNLKSRRPWYKMGPSHLMLLQGLPQEEYLFHACR